jgi:hypothetical protein
VRPRPFRLGAEEGKDRRPDAPLLRLCLPGRRGRRRGEEMVFAPTRISVKDFGPIREADVHLGKVTVLMGPNNTGKTYTTVLMLFLEQFLRLTQLTLEEFMRLEE